MRSWATDLSIHTSLEGLYNIWETISTTTILTFFFNIYNKASKFHLNVS